MTYRPRIHLLIPNSVDSTSFYRGVGVFSKLRHKIDCEFSTDTNISWASLAYDDILFMQRPWGKPYHKACQIAKNNGVPIWIDYDDYLLDIPDYNPGKRHFSNQYDQADMIEMLEMATVITVTTEHLKQKFSKHNDNVFIIENAFDDYTFKLEVHQSTNKVINWRGSKTHSEDLRTIIEPMRAFQNNPGKSDWLFHCIGEDASMLKGLLRYKEKASMDPIEYFHWIKEFNPSIQVVPLVENDFNLAKSNIAWIEATYSGAITLAPDFPEFRRPGIINYRSQEEFLDLLNLSTNKEAYSINSGKYNLSLSYIQDHLLLSKVNDKRVAIIKELIRTK